MQAKPGSLRSPRTRISKIMYKKHNMQQKSAIKVCNIVKKCKKDGFYVIK